MTEGKHKPKEVHLVSPTDEDLDRAYRSLCSGHRITVRMKSHELWEILLKMEKSGFVALEMINRDLDQTDPQIVGYKGKHGPCIDTGRTATYTGSAVAVMDDDNHVLLKDQPQSVCEKTAHIYGFSSYEGLIAVSSGSDELKERLKTDPRIFDCDALEDHLSLLYQRLKDRETEQERVNVFYPGPFKFMVLSDGTMVRRGKVSSIPAAQLKELKASDRLRQVPNEVETPAVYYQAEYPEKGSLCLSDNDSTWEGMTKPAEHATDLNALKGIHKKLKLRVKELIKSGKKYFILTGSDPLDDSGCCPSDEVGAANRLVRAGILSSITQESSVDACPVTIFAFKDEIVQHEDDIQFVINEDLRMLILSRLAGKRLALLQGFAKWSLIVFLLISTAVAVYRVSDMLRAGESTSLYKGLSPKTENTTMILLFHNQTRCTMCLNMEAHILALLQKEYPQQVSEGRIQFSLINMNRSTHQEYVRRFELYTASVVLVQFREREAAEIKILRDIWKYHADRDEFISVLQVELVKLIEG